MIHPDAFVHESTCVDGPADIGAGTVRARSYGISCMFSRARIGENCILGQSVVTGPDVVIGDRCKVQNNVAPYRGAQVSGRCGPVPWLRGLRPGRSVGSAPRARYRAMILSARAPGCDMYNQREISQPWKTSDGIH